MLPGEIQSFQIDLPFSQVASALVLRQLVRDKTFGQTPRITLFNVPISVALSQDLYTSCTLGVIHCVSSGRPRPVGTFVFRGLCFFSVRTSTGRPLVAWRTGNVFRGRKTGHFFGPDTTWTATACPPNFGNNKPQFPARQRKNQTPHTHDQKL